MGYGEVGALSPGTSTFRGPSGQVRIDEARGRQQASYLSQMDQFYAQLAESTREFDIMAGFKGREVTLAERHDIWQSDIAKEQLEFGRESLASQEALGYAELDLKSSLGRGESDYRSGMLDLAEREFGLREQEFGREISFEDIYAPQFAEEGLRRSRGEHASETYGVPGTSKAITAESLGIYTPDTLEAFDYSRDYDPTGFNM